MGGNEIVTNWKRKRMKGKRRSRRKLGEVERDGGEK